MTNRLKALLTGTACLACCVPLILGIIGATTGVAGATALSFARYDLAILAVIGLTTAVMLAAAHLRSPKPDPYYGGGR